MKLEQFIYGQFNGVGYKLIKSHNLDKVISKESLRDLLSLTQEGTYQSWIPERQLIAVSFIHKTKDKFERDGIWNHTIILTVQQFLNLVPTQFFDSYFITELAKPLDNLEPLEMKI